MCGWHREKLQVYHIWGLNAQQTIKDARQYSKIMFCVYIDWKLHTWFCLGTKLFIWSYNNYCMIAFTQVSKNCMHISKNAPTNLARDKSFLKVWSYCKIQEKNLKTLWFDSDMSFVTSPITIKLRTRKSTSKPQTDYHC